MTNQENNVSRLEGVDLSSYDKDVDFVTLAKTRRFAIIRVSHGTGTHDAKFRRNWQGVKEAGMIRGAYHYFRPDQSFQEQLDYFVQTIGQLEVGDLPPCLDLEEPEVWKSIAKADRMPLILKFLDGLEKAFGVAPMVYLSPSFVTDVLGVENVGPLKKYRLWIANYRVPSPHVPAPWSDWTFWQYSEKGTVPGIPNDGDCDLDVFNGSIEDLKALTVQTVTDLREDAGTSFSVQGCDVSSWQNDIDWSKVPSAKKFAIIRVAHGTTHRDVKFQQNWAAAKKAGVIRGVYHYFDPTDPFQEQVDYFIENVRLEKGDLPPALDLEDEKLWAKIPQKDRVPLAVKFLDQLERAYGVVPMVYLSPNFVNSVLGRENVGPLKKYPLWIANYKVAQPTVPAPWDDWTFWQYSETGSTPGVTGACDQDAFNGTLAELQAMTVQSVIAPNSRGSKKCHCKCRCRCCGRKHHSC